jgi:very-short-patch-repair endonuclease
MQTTPQTLSRARVLRKNMTDAELALWSKLRHKQLGVKFRRQVPIGVYIVDFYSVECQLVIELDGSQHVDQAEYDEIRTQYLHSAGLRVVRFWNHDVLVRTDAVIEEILRWIGRDLA